MVLPVSPLCDRDIVEIPQSQIGFIDVIVIPNFEAMLHVFPKFADNIRNLEENKNNWKDLVEQSDNEN